MIEIYKKFLIVAISPFRYDKIDVFDPETHTIYMASDIIIY